MHQKEMPEETLKEKSWEFVVISKRIIVKAENKGPKKSVFYLLAL